jgi:putative ATP-binding cassette transporter
MDSKSHTALVPGRRFLMIRLLMEAHPFLAIATMITGLVGGIAGVVTIDTINSTLHATGDRLHLLPTFILLTLSVIFFRTIAGLLPAYAARTVVTSLRMALCRKILVTPLKTLEATGMAKVITLLGNDIPALAEAILLMPSIFVSMTIVVCTGIYITYLSWVAALFSLVLVMAGLLIYSFFYRKAMDFLRKHREEVATLTEYTQGLMFGIKELQLNRQRRRWFIKAAFGFATKRVAQYNLRSHIYFDIGENIGNTAYFILIGLLIFAAPLFQHIEVSSLTACVLAILYGIEPLLSLTNMVPQLGRGTIACERFAKFGVVLSFKEEEQAKLLLRPTARTQSANWEEIVLQDIVVSYADGEKEGFTLGPISLTFRPGEIVFIEGGNGSGKSTLSKALTGLYAPDKGALLLDGQPVSDDNKETYRNLFATVFSDFYVFRHIVNPDRANSVATRAQGYLNTLRLQKKVQIERKKFSTTTALSQGERKRLALLTAYMEDRPIYLLDEWAADQDPGFKEFFYKVLLPDLKARGKCVIAITHDDRYFPCADRLIKLENGRVVSDIRNSAAANGAS